MKNMNNEGRIQSVVLIGCVLILTFFGYFYFIGFKNDIRKTFPSNFWPQIKGVGLAECVNLAGVYTVTIAPENQIEEFRGDYTIVFPAGLSAMAGKEFEVKQFGCERIEITYTNRFNRKMKDSIDREHNDLQWDSSTGLFSYNATAFEADGFAGKDIFKDDKARLGIGVDGSFLFDNEVHSAGRIFFIRGELMYYQKFKFPPRK